MTPTTVEPAAAAQTPCPRADACGCSAPAPVRVRLSDLQRGQTGVICECELSTDDAALLRAMGLCLSARVRLCRAGEPCIVAIQCGRRSPRQVVEDATRRRRPGAGGAAVGGGSVGGGWSGSRIGLARSLADRILVTLDAAGG